ncbi:MAG: hypothetical protein R2849_00860 [Thermomicrobiales bacterium]
MDAEVDARMFADHRVIQLDAAVEQCVGVIPALSIAFADFRVEQGGVLRRVDLMYVQPSRMSSATSARRISTISAR